MKRLLFLSLFLLLQFNHLLAQNVRIEAIEKDIKSKAIGGKFTKKIIDLNHDQKEDIIYFYQCGEPNCIQIFLNINGQYKQLLNEQYTTYILQKTGRDERLHLILKHCCGESPYYSNRVFEFNQASAELKENYVLINKEYVKDSKLLTPLSYHKPASGKITFDNYNMRFSPEINSLKYPFEYGCEDGTNIIAKLKSGAAVQILSELVEKDRTWLFVEVDRYSIKGKHNPVDFDFKDQKLRGWVSNKYVVTLME